MDILLHITGLAFIPIMVYILFLGVQDILPIVREHFAPQWKRATVDNSSHYSHQFYKLTT